MLFRSNRTETVLFPEVISIAGNEPIEVEGVQSAIEVNVVLQYNEGYNENVRCFANNIPNPDGGTHLSGFRNALTRALNSYGKKENLFKDIEPSGDDFREGDDRDAARVETGGEDSAARDATNASMVRCRRMARRRRARSWKKSRRCA